MSTQYDNIYFNQSRVSGEVRMSTEGLGWRATQKMTPGSTAKVSQPFLLPASELVSASWSRGAHDYMVQIQTRNGGIVSLDGFEQDLFTPLQRSLSSNLNLQLEHREHSLRGWNWGKTEFENNELVFNVASKPDFEIPYGTISSSNVVGKSEVAIEMQLPSKEEKVTYGDEIVEMRMYIPTVVQQTQDEETSETGNTAQDEEEPVNAAQEFHETLQDKANLGSVVGSEIANFLQVLFTTPRGRYDIQFYEDAFRLHGKTYDYKVAYTSMQRIFVLPRLDELHNILVVQLEPPLRQGQTRYPFLVMQFAKDDVMEVELNVEDADFEQKYAGKLERKYESSADDVVSSIFRGLSGKKVTSESKFKSTRNLPAVGCMLKATEAAIYPLDKAVLIVSKTSTYISYNEITGVTFTRMSTGNRSVDMTLHIQGNPEINLTNVPREDQAILEHFFENKNLKIRNDAEETRKQRSRIAESDVDMPDEDEEDDDDFDEEPPSESEGSGSESDAGSDGGSDAGSDDESDGGSEPDSDGEFDGDSKKLDTGDSKLKIKKDRKRVKSS